MVDDLRFKPAETRNAERLLALLRDEIVTEADLVGIVSTGPSGVATDLHSPADPRRAQRLDSKNYERSSTAGGRTSPRKHFFTVQIPAATPTYHS